MNEFSSEIILSTKLYSLLTFDSAVRLCFILLFGEDRMTKPVSSQFRPLKITLKCYITQPLSHYVIFLATSVDRYLPYYFLIKFPQP